MNQDIEQQSMNSVFEECNHQLLQSQNPSPSITLLNEQEPYSQLLESMIVKKKEKLQQEIAMRDYSPIQQELKSQISDIIQSVDPFNLDFDSSSSSEQIQWNQEYRIDSKGEILVTGDYHKILRIIKQTQLKRLYKNCVIDLKVLNIMNNIKQLIEAIQQVVQELSKLNINPEDRIPIISKILFKENLQSLDNLDQGMYCLTELHEYIDYLLYRLDFELNLNYQTNDKILSEILQCQYQIKEQGTQDQNDVKKIQRPRIYIQK